MQIKQLIVVEGKTDTAKLKKIFGSQIETIETNGLNVNSDLLNILEKINNTRGIIIFTDPDGPGQKIREQINLGLSQEVINAFISRPDNWTKEKIGIAEADEMQIKTALSASIIFSKVGLESITWEDYIKHDFYLASNRKIIASYFNWSSKINSKTLFKWLNWSGQTVEDINKILK
ncbi:primase-like protein [Spiroplasma sabaudiense Ar-1343]|uniref:Ribonuclease M5 n=1 Tax=Spiroplasma sabaudiense Ar-1343 TaxID=1276257 RepID=W6ABU9_9MOLU|nr:ribonuclease M5 [Spiroplasma sabaudiense]AHI54315.1 primase-like protein [Spiroplasma sabaudiense Ar-1343]